MLAVEPGSQLHAQNHQLPQDQAYRDSALQYQLPKAVLHYFSALY